MTVFPTRDAYRAALKTGDYWLTKKQRELLQAHRRAPNHTITATELAKPVGFPTYGGVDLHYGYLASKIAERMEWSVPAGEPELITLVHFEDTSRDEHCRLVLRPELVAALTDLGWK
jgi:hypothetical protein